MFFLLIFVTYTFSSLLPDQIVVFDRSDIEVYTYPEDNIAEVALMYANGTLPVTQFNETDLQLNQTSNRFEIVYDRSVRFWNLRRTGCLEAGYREWLMFTLQPHFGINCTESLQVTVKTKTRELLDVPSIINVSVCMSAKEIDIYNLTVENESACIRLDCSTNMSEFWVTDRTVKAAVGNISLNSPYTIGVACSEAGYYPHKLSYESKTELEITFSETHNCLSDHSPITKTTNTIKTLITMETGNIMSTVVTGPQTSTPLHPSCNIQPWFFNDPVKSAAVSMVAGIFIGVTLATIVYCLIQKWCLRVSFRAIRSHNGIDREGPEYE